MSGKARVGRQSFEVSGKVTEAGGPGEAAFDHPALGAERSRAWSWLVEDLQQDAVLLAGSAR
jgi:hypothetical protein